MRKIKLSMELLAMVAAFPVWFLAELNHGTKHLNNQVCEVSQHAIFQKDKKHGISEDERTFAIYPMIININ